MNKRIVCLSILLILLSSVPVCSETRADGNYWRSLRPSQKSYFVYGFFNGMDFGYRFSYWNFYDGKRETDKECADMVAGSYNKYIKYCADITNKQIVNGLDKFYAVKKNRSILILDGVWVVLKQIKGDSQGEIEQLIQYLRHGIK